MRKREREKEISWGEAPLVRVAFVCACLFVCLPGWSPLIRSNAVLNNNNNNNYYYYYYTGGRDYEPLSRTLTATNGAGPIDTSVTLIDDSIMEDTEEFGIRLNVTSDVRVDVHPSVASAKVVIKDIRDSKLPTYN